MHSSQMRSCGVSVQRSCSSQSQAQRAKLWQRMALRAGNAVVRADADRLATKTNVLAFMDSLPAGPRAVADCDAYDTLLKQERESREQ